MPILAPNTDRRRELPLRLEASAQRIAAYEVRLIAHAATMTPTDLDRLLDEYRAEQVRHENLYQELKSQGGVAQTEASKEKWRMLNKDRRKKLNY